MLYVCGIRRDIFSRNIFLRSKLFPRKFFGDIYTDVESDYWDWGTGEQVESQTSAEHIRRELEAAGDVTQINIYINSLGGSIMLRFVTGS